jgi:hypothetical protein
MSLQATADEADTLQRTATQRGLPARSDGSPAHQLHRSRMPGMPRTCLQGASRSHRYRRLTSRRRQGSGPDGRGRCLRCLQGAGKSPREHTWPVSPVALHEAAAAALLGPPEAPPSASPVASHAAAHARPAVAAAPAAPAVAGPWPVRPRALGRCGLDLHLRGGGCRHQQCAAGCGTSRNTVQERLGGLAARHTRGTRQPLQLRSARQDRRPPGRTQASLAVALAALTCFPPSSCMEPAAKTFSTEASSTKVAKLRGEGPHSRQQWTCASHHRRLEGRPSSHYTGQ